MERPMLQIPMLRNQHSNEPRFTVRRRFFSAVLLFQGLNLLVSPHAMAFDFSIRDMDFSFDVTNTSRYMYHIDNFTNDPVDGRYHQFLNALEMNLSYDVIRIGTRLDLNLFAEAPEVENAFPNQFTSEKTYLIIAEPAFDMTLGDFYASFGKGIALNVVKLDDLGQDTTIFGGKFDLHHKGLGLTFLAGEFNTLEVDWATGKIAPWAAEPVVGGRIENRFFDTLLLGAHGVYIIRDNGRNSVGADNASTDGDLVLGAGFDLNDLFDGALSLSGELDIQRSVISGRVQRGFGGEGDDFKGLAAYSSATLQVGDLTVLPEFKYYDDFFLGAPNDPDEPYILFYHQPPTLERIQAEIKDNTMVSGARLRVDYNFGQIGALEVLAFLNYGYFQNWSEHDEKRIQTPEGGIELLWQEGLGHLEIASGIRRTDKIEDSSLAQQDFHIDAEVEQSIASHYSLKATLVYLNRRRVDRINDDKWTEIESAISFKWSPYLDVGFMYEMQADPNLGYTEAKNFFGGMARYYITPSTYINIRGGQSKDGLKCLNGQCRFYPAFSGFETLAVVRF